MDKEGRALDTDSLEARLRLLATQTETEVFPVSVGVSPGVSYAEYPFLKKKYTLHSSADGFRYDIPELYPGFGFPLGGECVFVDGKVYSIGGERYGGIPGNEVFVMDIAGGREWEICQPMPYARNCEQSLTLFQGEIYVCGGWGQKGVIQVYNPGTNTWDVIQIMPGESWFDVVPGLLDATTAYLRLLETSVERFCEL